jgi:hypothetical protein
MNEKMRKKEMKFDFGENRKERKQRHKKKKFSK